MRGTRNQPVRAFRGLSVVIVGVLVAGTLAFTASAASAAEPLAKLDITADNVQIKQKGKSAFVDAKNGMALKQGDLAAVRRAMPFDRINGLFRR